MIITNVVDNTHTNTEDDYVIPAVRWLSLYSLIEYTINDDNDVKRSSRPI